MSLWRYVDVHLKLIRVGEAHGKNQHAAVRNDGEAATLSREIVLDALVMAVWRRKPQQRVLVHSDQGSQYGSDDWLRFCQTNNLEPSMSRRGQS